ncbi:MAG TPA: hypothetical protein VGM13_01280 [Thermoanaerobaculia bacterium]
MSDKWNGRDAALAAVVFATLSLLGQHTWGTVDAIQRFAVTRSLVERGSAVTPEFGPIKYGPLQSVLMVPTYLLGKALGALAGADPRQVGYRVTAFLFTPLLVTLLCVVFRRAALRAGAGERTALFGVFTLLFTTLLLPYTRLLFTEPLNALLVLLAASALLDASGGSASAARRLAAASALLVLNGAPFAPLAVAQIAFGAELARRRTNVRAALRVLFAGTSSLLAALGAWLLWNHARYGDALRVGYDGEGFGTPLAVGLSGLFVSIGRGIVLYSPPTVLALLALPFLLRRGRLGALASIATFYACAFAGYLVLYASWDSFEGGWCWGPRFLLPLVPVLHLAIPFLVASFPGWSRIRQTAFALPFVLGFAVNAAEDLGSWKDWEKATFGSGAVAYKRSVFEPRYAALLHSVEAGRAAARLPLFLAVAGASAFALSKLASRPEAGT